MAKVRKNATTGVMLAVLLGGIGAHRFYLGETGKGILYFSFWWSFIPAFIAIFEAFAMPARVRRYNDAKALETAAAIKMLTQTRHGS
jgi:TM2 domain-containing membrane protein YozV